MQIFTVTVMLIIQCASPPRNFVLQGGSGFDLSEKTMSLKTNLIATKENIYTPIWFAKNIYLFIYKRYYFRQILLYILLYKVLFLVHTYVVSIQSTGGLESLQSINSKNELNCNYNQWKSSILLCLAKIR